MVIQSEALDRIDNDFDELGDSSDEIIDYLKTLLIHNVSTYSLIL